MVLTGKDTDYQILYRLNDYDLGNMCKTNPYFRSLCLDDIFWLNRTINRFGSILGDIENMKIYKGDQTWRNYYISLVNKIKNYYKYESDPQSEDWRLIRNEIVKRTKNYIDCYKTNQNNCSLDWTNADLVNIGEIFWTMVKVKRISDTEKIKLFDSLLDNPDFKITDFQFEDYLKEKAIKLLFNKKKENPNILFILQQDALENGEDYSISLTKKIFSDIELNDLTFLIEKYIFHYKIYTPTLNLLLNILKKSWTKKDFINYYKRIKEEEYFNIGYEDDRDYQKNLKFIKKYINKL